jgi:heat shock protein HtpX
MSEPSPQPILVYDRIAQNRRRSIFLLALFAIILLPFAAQATMLLIPLLQFRLLLSDDELKNLAPAFLVVMSYFPVIILSAVLFGYCSASALVRRMLHARPIQLEEEPELYRTVENLCIGAGLPQPKLYVLESNAPNVCAIGLNPAEAALVVTRGLMDLLDRRELEGVIAHELSHIGNHDICLNTLVAVLVTTLRLPLLMAKNMWPPAPAVRDRQNMLREYGYALKAMALVFSFALWFAAGLDLIIFLQNVLFEWSKTGGVAASVVTVVLFFFFGPLSILFVPFPIYVFIGAPGLGRLIGAAALRRREFLADADAALLTRNPAGLARALAKIAAAATGTFDVNPALYHLCVVSPVERRFSWWQMDVATHPPIEERIARLEELGDGVNARKAEKPSLGLKIALFVLAFVAANVLAALAFYLWLLTGARK